VPKPSLGFGFWVLGFGSGSWVLSFWTGSICAKYLENCAVIRIQAMFEKYSMFEKMALSQKKKKKKSGLWDR